MIDTRWFRVLLMFVGLVFSSGLLRADEENVPLDQLPKEVTKAIKDKYPNAELIEATREKEDDEFQFEVTIKNAEKKIDITLSAKGVVLSLEKQITAKELPKAVTESLEKKYPKAEVKQVEAVYEIEDGKEEFEYYEVTLETADKKTVEVKLDEKGEIEDEESPETEKESNDQWTSDFSSERADLVSKGRNPFFVLEPGYQLVLEDGKEQLTITVLDETRKVDGVETRIVEERETKDGKLVEVSRNFFAISKRTNNVYYFGEEVDFYKNEKISGHEGSWLSGINNAQFGLAMPGSPLIGAKYQQEVAPGVAMDRAEITSVQETVKVTAGEFKNCLKIAETTPLEPGNEEFKLYAPNVGLLVDGSLKLVRYGKVEPKK